MATGSEIEDLTRSIAEDVIEAAQRELGGYRTVNGKKRRSVASGNLKNSLNYTFTKRYNNPVLSFSASGKAGEYLRYVTEGRRKGAKMPPLESVVSKSPAITDGSLGNSMPVAAKAARMA